LGDSTVRWAKIGKVSWPLGFADAVLIKTIFGNGDLESSQWGIGRPGANGMVSVVARDIPFLTEIFGAGVAEAEKAQNVGCKRKTPGVDLSSSGVNFLAFLP
jgi:hypothetical protein